MILTGISFSSLRRNKKDPQRAWNRPLVKIIQSKTFLIYTKINYSKI